MSNVIFYKMRHFVLGFTILMALGSCGGSKRAQKENLYLQGNLDTIPNTIVPSKEVTIQKGDLLSITVHSDNPEATAIFNQQKAEISSGLTASSGTAGGYLVDQSGNISFQSLGTIHVEGLTKQALIEKLTEALKQYLKNPYVNIRFLNFRFTVIGEVLKPGSYTIPEEKISILEMIGLAGDLSVYGRRDNILVIRESNGKREFGRLDLRKASVFQSPYYYLQQNDIVFVEPNSKKPTANDQVIARNLTIASAVAALVSTLAIIYNIFK
jgi:polysaccharide export outer membrane protein